MTPPPDAEDMPKLASSLCSLLEALVQLVPDSDQETMETDQFLTLLEKALDDARALHGALRAGAR